MMGKLIWLMGPSGSGKDSLLAELRLREQTQLLVAHRYITRDASAWKTVAVKTPVKLTPAWRAPPAILHRIAIRSTMTAACASRSTRC